MSLHYRLIFYHFLLILLFSILSSSAQIIDTDWIRRYDGPSSSIDEASTIVVDDSGNVCVSGKSFGYYSTAYDFATIKYYPTGDTAWVRRYNGPGNGDDKISAMGGDGFGNIYVTGFSYGLGTESDYTTIKYNPNGDTAWVRRYDGPANGEDKASALVVDNVGNIYIAGYTTGSSSAHDYTTVKYDSDGNIIWVRNYNGPSNAGDEALSTALDLSGNLYVTGHSEGGGTYSDYTTIKYLSNGDTAWVRRYNGPKNSWDYASEIMVDVLENVIVTGYSYNYDTDFDYVTIKYYPNGDTAWVRRYNGEENSLDEATALTTDDEGNIYVTGRSLGDGTGYDYLTIKYYPDGNTAWIKKYNGSGNQDDRAWDIVVDDSGMVYVTGTTGYKTGSDDFTTVAYHSNGDTAWVRDYSGPGNGIDHSSALTVDDSNNVYVTGSSQGNETTYDFATIKYRPFILRSDTLKFVAYSPVDLIVTAPNEDSIGINFNTIPEAVYDTTQDLNGDQELDDLVLIPNPMVEAYLVEVVGEPGSNGGNYTLAVKINGNEDTPMANAVNAPGPAEIDSMYYPVTEYLRGDPNSDGFKNISDVVYLINYIFNQGPESVPWFLSDTNCDAEVTISDIVYLINYLFRGDKAPCS